MLQKSIRKISIGSDVNNQLHISKGSKMGDVIIDTIVEQEPNHYVVYVNRDDVVFVWKNIIGMPVIVEFDTRFE